MPSSIAGLTGLTALLLALPGGWLAPVTTKYRLDQTLTQVIDGTAMGKGKQSLSFTTSIFLTVTLTDSTGGRSMRVVIDSIHADSTAPIPPAVFDSARGAEYRGFLTKAGRPSRLQAVSTSRAAIQIQGLLVDFFPWVRPGIKVGEAWTDTSATTSGEGADSVTVQRITVYRAAANERRNARKAIRVTTDYTSNVSGTQPTENGPANLQGSGTGKGAYFVSPDGVYLGGDWQLESALKVSGSFVKEPLPITISQTTKVSTLR
jgi:hypothetical protein